MAVTAPPLAPYLTPLLRPSSITCVPTSQAQLPLAKPGQTAGPRESGSQGVRGSGGHQPQGIRGAQGGRLAVEVPEAGSPGEGLHLPERGRVKAKGRCSCVRLAPELVSALREPTGALVWLPTSWGTQEPGTPLRPE